MLEGNQDQYKLITNILLDRMKEKGLFWRKPWKGGAAGMAKNFLTKKPYQGINHVLLTYATNHSNPNWLTKKQIEKLKGTLAKGAKPEYIVYYSVAYKDENGKPIKATDYDEGKHTKLPFLKTYKVYNGEDIEDIPFIKAEIPPLEKKTDMKDKDCEKIIRGYKDKPKINWKNQDRAYYTSMYDQVYMPNRDMFEGVNELYSTLFHELAHSTGHQSRLNRKLGNGKETKAYAFEELIAELTACYLCGITGLFFKTRDNAAAYLKGWQSRLEDTMKENPSFFLSAAAKAQVAADYILGKTTINGLAGINGTNKMKIYELSGFGFNIGRLGATEAESYFIGGIKKFLDSARSGTISQSDYNTYNQIIDVDKSLALTKKFMNKVVLTTDKTTVYRTVTNAGEFADGLIFNEKNQQLGKVYGGFYSKYYRNEFVILDSLLDGKIRIIAVSETTLKPGQGGGSSTPVTTNTNTNTPVGTDVKAPDTETKKYSSGGSNNMLLYGAAAAAGLAILTMGGKKKGGLLGLLGLAPKKKRKPRGSKSIRINIGGQYIKISTRKVR